MPVGQKVLIVRSNFCNWQTARSSDRPAFLFFPAPHIITKGMGSFRIIYLSSKGKNRSISSLPSFFRKKRLVLITLHNDLARSFVVWSISFWLLNFANSHYRFFRKLIIDIFSERSILLEISDIYSCINCRLPRFFF